jgi:tetratricopeptide (TPR) repeat protein
MFCKKIPFIVCLSLLSAVSMPLVAQPPQWTIDLLGKEKKPEKFENKKLGSEKTENKKFTFFRRFVQNNITRYNFYFNAANKLDGIVERAKVAQQNDYSKLLPFYPYSLENTASQNVDLDSVIIKCTAGILLHDLRNDWIDNLYLLIGKAYLLRKDFDSAGMTFQFINYNLFPRKKGEDDSRVVGTTSAAAKGNVISIANEENRNFVQKVMTKAPSRNDALVWLVRNLTEQEEYGEAAGLINTLQNDPNFPKRLNPDLEEVAAYWFYKQGEYDSASLRLEKALANADTKQDRARWEFLLAQLFEKGGAFEKASDYYDRAAKHTVDPLMDIYAKLNDAKMMRQGGNAKELQNSIDKLVHMARRDKFESYRDVIYYSAGQISLQKPDTAAGIAFFKKSLLYNTDNVSYKNRAFLQLGDIAYEQKRYKDAFSWYDSLQSGDTSFADVIAKVQERRNALSEIVKKIDIVEREDSLQRIAAMAPADRDAFLKKMSKKLRKERGLKEEDNTVSSGPINFDGDKNKPIDLFESNNSKGGWYFYNNALRGRGFNEFRTKWGDRPNVDNWRRKAAMQAALSGSNNNQLPADAGGSKKGDVKAGEGQVEDITFDGLQKNLPLTPEKLAESNVLLSENLYALALLYQQQLEDYEQAIVTYDIYLDRYPDSLHDGDIYLNLYFCYSKLGNAAKAAYYKNLLTKGKFANTKAAKTVTNPGAVNPSAKTPEATRTYEAIYNMFIEGRFEEALAQKKAADSIYGKNYWSPQLLYIEAVYYVKQRNDSTANMVLSDIVNLYPKSPLKAKAQNLMDVLKRRKEIEDYLTKLEVTRAKEDDPIKVDDNTVPVTRQVQGPVVIRPKDTVTAKPKDTIAVIPKDTVVTKPPVQPVLAKDTVKRAPALVSGPFRLDVSEPHYVLMIMDKVDPVYVNEAKNAFVRYSRESYNAEPLEVNKDTLDKDRNLLVFVKFATADAALQYCEKLRRAAPLEVSWLPAPKYSFIIVSEDNLKQLKINKDIINYRKLLNLQYPGKF